MPIWVFTVNFDGIPIGLTYLHNVIIFDFPNNARLGIEPFSDFLRTAIVPSLLPPVSFLPILDFF